MSYILDALKKVEHEKLKKTMPTGMTSIAGDLFSEKIQQRSNTDRWKTVALIVLASLVTFTGTWLMLRNNKAKKVPFSSSTVPSVVTHSAPPGSVPIVAHTKPAVPISAATPPVVRLPSLPTPELSMNEKHSIKPTKIRTTQSPAAALAGQQKSVSQTIQPPADIKLSGIAWQEEHSARRAVVNGFLIKEGGAVSGTKITEIMADRVRFSSPTGAFEIRLDASPSVEVR